MLARISKHLRRIDYLDLSVSGSVVSDIKFLKLGQLLLQNIIRERSKDQKEILEESFDFSSFPQNYLTKSPAVWQRKNSPPELISLLNFQSAAEESPAISLNSCKVLSSSNMVSSRHAFELFHQLQRQRKIWWMKFLYNPGRVVFANPTRTDSCHTISISMKCVETGFNIELERVGLFTLDNSGKKTNVLGSWFSVDTSVLCFLIDALPELQSNDLTLHLNRRLSPYKLCLLTEDRLSGDLKDFARLVELELGNTQLNVLNEIGGSGNIADKFAYADGIGIPYSLILGEESLQTGCIKLRNRNTTLTEVIHLTDLPKYVERVIEE